MQGIEKEGRERGGGGAETETDRHREKEGRSGEEAAALKFIPALVVYFSVKPHKTLMEYAQSDSEHSLMKLESAVKCSLKLIQCLWSSAWQALLQNCST